MGKDAKKYRYLTVGLSWQSEVLKRLEADANKHQMGDQLPKMIALRLTEYYDLVERGFVVPGLTVRAQSENAQPPEETVESETNETKRNGTTSEDEAIVLNESNTTDSNADAALNFFLEQDA